MQQVQASVDFEHGEPFERPACSSRNTKKKHVNFCRIARRTGISWMNFVATSTSASAGHGWNQSMVVQFTSPGYIRVRLRKLSPIGDIARTTWRFSRTLLDVSSKPDQTRPRGEEPELGAGERGGETGNE